MATVTPTVVQEINLEIAMESNQFAAIERQMMTTQVDPLGKTSENINDASQQQQEAPHDKQVTSETSSSGAQQPAAALSQR